MSDQSIEVQIEAPAETVWSILRDAAAWPTWAPTVTSVEVLDEAPLQVGTRVRIQQPRIGTNEWTVTRYDDGRGFTWESRGPGVHSVADHEVEPLGPGRSRLRLRVTQSGVIARPIGWLYRGLTDRYLALEANGLKSRAEQSVSPPLPPTPDHPQHTE